MGITYCSHYLVEIPTDKDSFYFFNNIAHMNHLFTIYNEPILKKIRQDKS